MASVGLHQGGHVTYMIPLVDRPQAAFQGAIDADKPYPWWIVSAWL